MERALVITSVASMVDQFFLPHIRLLQDMGYEVHMACNFVKGSTCSQERILGLKKKLADWNVTCYQIDFARDVTNISSHIKAYKQIIKIVDNKQYHLVHCHSPIGGLLTRIACRNVRKKGTRVFYTAHGFHFFKGAPLKNWLIYYPVEKFCSYFTDVLITINQEDYDLAQRKMKAKKIAYVPGVGLDVARFAEKTVDRVEKRRELGIPEDALLLLSVGELNVNKNHQVIIRALAQMKDPNIHYAVVGKGNKREMLENLSRELGVHECVHLLGFRDDVNEICGTADVFCLPSHREGLGLAALEAMAYGLPLITSNIHGINDYSEQGVSGYKCAPTEVEGFAEAIGRLAKDPANRLQMGKHNAEAVSKYDLAKIVPAMMRIYKMAGEGKKEHVSI